jgi:hypothetical protein
LCGGLLVAETPPGCPAEIRTRVLPYGRQAWIQMSYATPAMSYANPLMSYDILLMSYVIPIMSYATPKKELRHAQTKKLFNLDKTECTSMSVIHTFAVQLRFGDFPSSKIFSQFFKRPNYS